MERIKTLWIIILILVVTSCSNELGTTREAATTVENPSNPPAVADHISINQVRKSMVRHIVSYLEITRAPCVPINISKDNTCPTGTPTFVDTMSVHGMGPMWPLEGGVPTLTEIMLGQGATLASVHLVVRGVVQKNTTRCGVYPIKIPNYMNESSLFWKLYHYHCFAQIDVSEYITGTGPAMLTVSLHQETISEIDLGENKEVKEEILFTTLKNPKLRTSKAYEGKELILLLIPTISVTVEGWQTAGEFAMWFVQQVTPNDIRVVAQDIIHAETDEQRNQLNRPLGEFTEQIKQAYNERNNITGGKVGTYPSTLPAIVTDANFLQTYYISVGAVYDETDDSTVLPPPVPGENDPAPPTIPTNEATTTTSVLIPGEETITPPATDDTEIPTTISTSTTTIVETEPTINTPTTITTTTTTISDTTTTTQTAEPTTTTEATVTETVTGTTTTTTEPPNENGDSTEEPTTTTSTLPPEGGIPSEEGISPEEENNPGPGASPSDDDGTPGEGAPIIPPGDDSGLSPADNQDTDDEQTA